MKEKHQKMRLNASGHQSENERQLKKFNYSEQKHIKHFLHNSCFEDVLVEKYAVLNMFNRQDSFAFLFLLTNCLK